MQPIDGTCCLISWHRVKAVLIISSKLLLVQSLFNSLHNTFSNVVNRLIATCMCVSIDHSKNHLGGRTILLDIREEWQYFGSEKILRTFCSRDLILITSPVSKAVPLYRFYSIYVTWTSFKRRNYQQVSQPSALDSQVPPFC